MTAILNYCRIHCDIIRNSFLYNVNEYFVPILQQESIWAITSVRLYSDTIEKYKYMRKL
jgi:hypothetical protein